MAVELTRLFMIMILLVISVICFCACAPVVGEETVYDQRQNGTENFRVHIKGVVIVHAPLEALLASVSGETQLQEQLMGIFGGISSAGGNDLVRPSIESVTSFASPSAEKTTAAAEESTATAASSDTTTGQPQGQADKPLKTK
jgi:hypothetical protein